MTPIILRVQARQASEKGVQFYIGNEKVWLADRVPPEFIVVPDE
jgi:putative RNA 2'-phosphotransferase